MYTKTALKRYQKDNIISLYIKDQEKFFADTTVLQEENKQLLIDKAQAEGNLKLFEERFEVTINEETAKIRVENHQLKKENEELKSHIDSNSPNNKTTVKNLQNIIKEQKEQLENYKKNELIRETFLVEKYDILHEAQKELATMKEKQEHYHKIITDLYDSL